MLLQYNELRNAAVVGPGLQSQFGASYGLGNNAFRYANPEGSLYAQDRWEYEGMVVNGGLRFDFFSPGSGVGIEINDSGVRREVKRWQTQWSPRLGFAFPITDRDVFHFHYGRFIQFPEKDVIFASQDVNQEAWTLGNPNLEPETSVSYQAGIKHQFSNAWSGQVHVFNKAYYGLVQSVSFTDDSTGAVRQRFVNKAYASSRGVELSVAKSFSNSFAFEMAYTYAFADGVASDADFGREAEGLAYLPVGELPLDWDQRHS